MKLNVLRRTKMVPFLATLYESFLSSFGNTSIKKALKNSQAIRRKLKSQEKEGEGRARGGLVDECCLKLFRGFVRTSSLSLYLVQGVSRFQSRVYPKQGKALLSLFFKNKIYSTFQFSSLLLIYLLTI